MGRHPTSSRKYEIQHLWDKHFEIARLAVMGYHPSEIAPVVNMTKEHISSVFNSDVFKAHVVALRNSRDEGATDVNKRIIEMAPVAMQRLREVAEEPLFIEDPELGKIANPHANAQLSVKVSQDLLDRAGYGAIERKETMNYQVSDLIKLKDAAIAAGIESGQVVVEDAEVVSEETIREEDCDRSHDNHEEDNTMNDTN